MNRDREIVFPPLYEEIETEEQYNKKYEYNYPVLRKCIINIMNDTGPSEIIDRMKLSKIGLYAVNELLEYILWDFHERGAEKLVRIYDRNSKRFENGYKGMKVGGINRLLKDYNEHLIQKVVVCNLIHTNDIVNEFISIGIKVDDIIIADSLIYGCK